MKRLYLLLSFFFVCILVDAQGIKNVSKWIEKGEKAEKKGDFEKAIHYYELTKDTYEKCDSIDEKLVDVLATLGYLYSKLGDSNKAVEYGIKAKDVVKTIYGENHPDYAILLRNIAGYYFDSGNYDQAVKFCIKAIDAFKIIHGENHPKYAKSLIDVVIYCYTLGDYYKAIEYGTKAMEICKAVLGENDMFYAMSLGLLAKSYFNLHNYSTAIEYGIKEMEAVKDILGEDHHNYATSLGNLAEYCSAFGDYSNAKKYGIKSLEIRKLLLGENHPDCAKSLSNLAVDYSNLGDYSKAIEYGTKAAKIEKAILGEDHPDYAISLNNLAEYYSKIGDHSKAIEYGTKAVEINKAILGENHPDYAISLNNLTYVYSNLGDYHKAIEYGEKALEIQKVTLGENHPDYAISLNNLAEYCSKIGNHSKAIEYGTKAVEIDKAILGENHPDYAISLNNLAYVYSNLGDYHKAIEYGEKALEIQKVALGDKHPLYAISLNNLANAYSDIGDYSKAVEYGTQAVEIDKTVLGKNHPEYALTLNNLAIPYFKFGKHSKAIDCFKEAVSIERNDILSVLSFFPASQRSIYWDKYSTIFTDSYPELLYKSGNHETSDLYNQSALFAKGLLLSTTTEMNKLILESGDDEALHMYEELRLKRMELQKLYEKPITDRFVNTDSLKTMADQLEKKLVERSKVYGDYTKKLQTTWKDVQQSLADDELAVEFLSFNVYGTDSTMVVALTLRKDDKEPKFFPLFELRQLKELSDTVTFICPNLTSLVWQPLHDELKGIKTIYFSPVGVLHKIGIEYAPGMESYEIFRLSSTREIIDLKAPQKNTDNLSARLYGGINYEPLTPTESEQNKAVSDASLEFSISQHRTMMDSLDLRGIQIDYLPGTLREVQNIQKTLTNKHYNATAYTGAKATETSIKSLSGKDTGILHISTHGFYYTESQAKKKEKLRFLSFDDRHHHANNEDKTLTRSGLLMAGAKITIDGKDIPLDSDDGILTAQEISMLDLRGTDLVVLSACETGRGDIMQGEGVFGLQRGFKKAGVKSILMSLWKVSDVSTEILMTEFYKNLCNGKSKRESLRLAQKTVREYKDDEGNLLFQDPHYWAGFIILD